MVAGKAGIYPEHFGMTRRYNRTEFVAFGVLPMLNTLALLIRGLYISTGSNYAEGKTIPALVVLAALCLLGALVAAVRRGYDLNLNTAASAGVLVLCVALTPLLLLVVIALCVAQGRPDPAQPNRFGPPGGMNVGRWLWAVLWLIAPWAVLLVLTRVL